MSANRKEYTYARGNNPAADRSFDGANTYGKVKLGGDWIFWKEGLRQCALQLTGVKRAYRRVEEVPTKLCCGRTNFDVQSLVLVLTDGTELTLKIGDGMQREAEALFSALKQAHPELEYGKI